MKVASPYSIDILDRYLFFFIERRAFVVNDSDMFSRYMQTCLEDSAPSSSFPTTSQGCPVYLITTSSPCLYLIPVGNRTLGGKYQMFNGAGWQSVVVVLCYCFLLLLNSTLLFVLTEARGAAPRS